MKNIVAILTFTFACASAFSQPATKEIPVLATSIVASAAKIPLADVVINPNPVKGQNFNLQLQNLETGKYNIYVFDKEGRKFMVKTVSIEEADITQQIDLPKEITSGTYILQVISKTARFSRKMIVE